MCPKPEHSKHWGPLGLFFSAYFGSAVWGVFFNLLENFFLNLLFFMNRSEFFANIVTASSSMPVACLYGNARPDGLVSRPDRDPTSFKNPSRASQAYPTHFSLKILSFCVLLSWVSAKSQLILSSCAYFYPF